MIAILDPISKFTEAKMLESDDLQGLYVSGNVKRHIVTAIYCIFPFVSIFEGTVIF